MMARSDPQMMIRLPIDVKGWVAQQAERHGSSQNSEVVRALRERMERVERQADGAKEALI